MISLSVNEEIVRLGMHNICKLSEYVPLRFYRKNIANALCTFSVLDESFSLDQYFEINGNIWVCISERYCDILDYLPLMAHLRRI